MEKKETPTDPFQLERKILQFRVTWFGRTSNYYIILYFKIKGKQI